MYSIIKSLVILTPKNDLEWLKGHFLLNFLYMYYDLALRVLLAGFESIFLLIYCRVCLHTHDQQRCGK